MLVSREVGDVLVGFAQSAEGLEKSRMLGEFFFEPFAFFEDERSYRVLFVFEVEVYDGDVSAYLFVDRTVLCLLGRTREDELYGYAFER